ncbi:DEAD/DEAH box helicase family protein [Shewanella sp.]|uniref:DEAD/DEAH box helicase family protein n=1 Tax=Shewanella sp. TaxID=50422 RepID=UPI003567445F
MEIPTFGSLTPRPYQWEAIQNIKQFIREQFASFKNGGEVKNAILNASVSSGKSLIMGAVAAHCQATNHRCMILTDIGELAEQNGQEAWSMGVKTSYYSAYVGVKSNYYNVVSATLGTVYNGLSRDYSVEKNIPKVLLIDECQKLAVEDFEAENSSQYAQVINHFKKLNPKLVVIGFTGTPWRGTSSIIGGFWSEELKPVVDREFLKLNGYTVPDVFGFTDHQYELGEFNSFTDIGTGDYSKDDLERMQAKMDLSKTQAIMHDVMDLVKDRNGVLVTCSGFKHAQEAASVLGDIPYAIFTTQQMESNTGLKTRKEIVDAIKTGKIKYLFQIGCFSVGFSAPYIDTSVILRRIGSLTLLEQLLGRGRRLPNQWMKDAGIAKEDHLVLDFSGTLEAMADLFNNPVLDDAMKAKDKKDGAFIHCPVCGSECGVHARKCQNDNCDHWFKFRECEDLRLNNILIEKGCGAKNDIASKICSNCNKYLIDPNANLSHKPYSDADWKPVLKMELAIIGQRSDAIQVKYYFDSYGIDGKQEVATVNYWAIMAGGKRVWDSKFIKQHCKPAWWKKALQMTPALIVQSADMFITPKEATHRINAKGESIVNVKKKVAKNEK